MKFKIRTLFSIVLGLICFVAAESAIAQAKAKIKRERMQRDLKIMENVLDDIFTPSDGRIFFSGGSRGLYFDDYGLVFQVRLAGLGEQLTKTIRIQQRMEAVEKARKREKKNREDFDADEEDSIFIFESHGTKKGKVQSPKERLEKIKTQSVQFMGDYIDGVGQLLPDNRITLLFDFAQKNLLLWVSEGEGSTQAEEWLPSRLEVTALKRDVTEYRKGKLTEVQFRKRLTFTERRSENGAQRSLSIMGNILNAAIQERQEKDFGHKNDSPGIYLNGLGALFFLEGSLFPKSEKELFEGAVIDYMEEGQSRGAQAHIQARKKATHDYTEKFKTELVELLGDYGHTLRMLKPSEHLVVQFELKNHWGLAPGAREHLVVKIKKQDLDRYDRGELTLAQLRTKVEYQEY